MKISVNDLREILRIVEEECKKLNIKIITQDDRDVIFKTQRPLQYIAYDCKENICKRIGEMNE